MKILVYIALFFLSVRFYGQKEEIFPPTDEVLFMEKGDTLEIALEEVTLLPKQKFTSREDVRYYYWLRKKVHKAYPYAKLATEKLDSLQHRLGKIKKRRKKKKYIRAVQRYLEGEFTDELKKMTRTEGRFLIKLLYRQTGKTVFDQIKELRSGWRAFWYQTTAKLFKLSLKSVYDPTVFNEDFLIEDILQRSFLEGSLEEAPSKLHLDLAKMYENHAGAIDVEFYKRFFSNSRGSFKK